MVIEVTFKNVVDFRRRITALWQNQKEDEFYNFNFPDDETEREFDKLRKAFQKI